MELYAPGHHGYRRGLLGRKPIGQCIPQFIRNARSRQAVNESLDAVAQFRGRGLGEGNRNDLTGGNAGCKKKRHAPRHKRRLTAPGTSLHEQRRAVIEQCATPRGQIG